MFKNVLFLLLIINSAAFAQAITIGQRLSFESKILNQQRDLLVYTPPSYGFNDNEQFPVLYMVDADYNFHYVTGLIELLSSISANIPEMLVVGISGKGTGTYRKQSKPPYDVSDKGSADVTLKFINDEVMPLINSKYKTNGYKILAGHSIGGLFSTYAMLSEHEMFDAFIAISPSLWWEDEALKKQTLEQFAKKQQIPATFYISLANEKGMGVHGFVEMLQSKGPRSLNLHFKHFPDESHGSVGLATYRWALQDLFASYRPEGKFFTDAKAVADYYLLNKEKYKTTFHISAGFLRNTVYAYSKDKDKRFAIEGAMIQYFPNQVEEFRNIEIEGLIGVGKLSEAQDILNRTIKNNPNDFSTLANQSRLLGKQKKNKQALTAINKAIDIAKDIQIRQWLTNELIEQKEQLLK
jgi:predicted alpha/beta superfamily hydrolase